MFFTKIFQGLGWLQESFLLLWRHKKLLVYKLISIAIKLVSIHILMPPHGKHSFIGALLLFIQLFIKYFLDLSLTGCTLQLLKNRTCSFFASLCFGIVTLRQLVWWTSWWVFIQLMALAWGFAPVIVDIYRSLIMLFITFYVFPLLVSQQLSLTKAVYQSASLVSKSWVQIIAATMLLWPVAKIMRVFTFTVGWPLIFIAWMLEAVLMTLVIIVRTVAYTKKPPLH